MPTPLDFTHERTQPIPQWEALFRTVFDQSTVSTQILAPDGTTVAVNRAWETLWGATLADLHGYNLLHDEQLVAKGVMPFIMRAFDGEPVTIPTIQYVPEETLPGRSTVKYRWVAGSAYPVKDADGNVRQVVLMHEDVTDRIEAEEALRESEERFRAIFDEAPIGISLIDPEGRYLAANLARQEMLGYGADELIGRSYLELTHPEDVDYDQEVNDQARESGRNAYQLEKRFVRRDGQAAFARVTVRTIRDREGRALYSIVVTEDITRRRHVEEALRDAEERYRRLVEQLPVAAYLAPTNADEATFISPAVERMLGYSSDEWMSRHAFWLTAMHPDDRERLTASDRASRETGERFHEEYRMIARDGRVVWVHDEAVVVRDNEGQPWLHGVFIDVTDRKAAEQERMRLYELEHSIRRQAERLAAERAAILGQIAEGIIIADPEGRLIFVNDEAKRIYGIAALGIEPEEYSRTYHVYTMDGDPYPSLDLPLSRAVLNGETCVNIPLWVRRADGSEVFAQASAAPVTAEDGTRLGAVLAVRDVTAERALEQHKDDFLSAAAHDLRTPLTSMKGRVQLLRRRIEHDRIDREQMLIDLQRIDSGFTRMSTLIAELLDVANIQIGRPIELNRIPIDLVDLVRQAVVEQQNAMDRHRITVETKADALTGNWDVTRLERVLSNLLSNAVKYSPEGGDITVFVGREGDEATLAVGDRGIGIPPEDLPHVFDRFRRGQNAAGKIPGTGIGLAAVRDIVERHGGTIQAANRDGGGALFTMRLPLDANGDR